MYELSPNSRVKNLRLVSRVIARWAPVARSRTAGRPGPAVTSRRSSRGTVATTSRPSSSAPTNSAVDSDQRVARRSAELVSAGGAGVEQRGELRDLARPAASAPPMASGSDDRRAASAAARAEYASLRRPCRTARAARPGSRPSVGSRRGAVPALAGGHGLPGVQRRGVAELRAVAHRGADVEHRRLADEHVPAEGDRAGLDHARRAPGSR